MTQVDDVFGSGDLAFTKYSMSIEAAFDTKLRSSPPVVFSGVQITFHPDTYSLTLKDMGEKCGVHGLQEHSARRGGAGFYCFVIRRDFFFTFRAFAWETGKKLCDIVGSRIFTTPTPCCDSLPMGRTNYIYHCIAVLSASENI